MERFFSFICHIAFDSYNFLIHIRNKPYNQSSHKPLVMPEVYILYLLRSHSKFFIVFLYLEENKSNFNSPKQSTFKLKENQTHIHPSITQ